MSVWEYAFLKFENIHLTAVIEKSATDSWEV